MKSNLYGKMYERGAKYFVVIRAPEGVGYSLATRAGFLTFEEAQHYASSINEVWEPMIVGPPK